ncbi:serine/threonine protein kinase [Legionella beliardensis]|uniref:Serine/threonine protein kinase n=1 Tax=Legionella beliardensis TaxID=91822 RepID=A0A378I523_9GAMM|nr:protein kinase [Legionella beliardensis]STX29771.1 serine/threonine protein kinase [Legionella beliardensis]
MREIEHVVLPDATELAHNPREHFEYLKKLESFINRYNEADKTDNQLNWTLLEVIIQITDEIVNAYHNKPVFDDRYYHLFGGWYKRNYDLINEYAKELREQAKLENTAGNILSPPAVKIWQKKTKPKSIFSKERSDQYLELDLPIAKIEEARVRAVQLKYKDRDANTTLRDCLYQLEATVFSILSRDADILSEKDLMRKRLYHLLEQTSAALGRLSTRDEALFEIGKITPQFPDKIINPASEGKSRFEEIIVQLYTTQDDFSHNGFNLHYLGGNNNRNWIASHDSDGRTYVIRLEKADDPPTEYLLIDELKKNKQTSPFIAQDFFYHPTQRVNELGRPINLAISEYCPQGNLIHYIQSNFPATELASIACAIADITRQIAEMALVFKQNGFSYMDIKAENFLVRNNGAVITADLKSILLIEDEHISRPLIVSTVCNMAPEHRLKRLELMDPEKYMVYQIGLLLYDLATNQQNKDEVIDKLLDDKDLENTLALDFSSDIFQTPLGVQITELINAMINKDHVARLTLDAVIQKCKEISTLKPDHTSTLSTSSSTVSLIDEVDDNARTVYMKP